MHYPGILNGTCQFSICWFTFACISNSSVMQSSINLRSFSVARFSEILRLELIKVSVTLLISILFALRFNWKWSDTIRNILFENYLNCFFKIFVVIRKNFSIIKIFLFQQCPLFTRAIIIWFNKPNECSCNLFVICTSTRTRRKSKKVVGK